jgi:hypothetical protein
MRTDSYNVAKAEYAATRLTSLAGLNVAECKTSRKNAHYERL